MLRTCLFLVGIALSASAWADGCTLNLVNPKKSNLEHPPEVAVGFTDTEMWIQFTIQTATLNQQKPLGPKQYPYMFDVVEAFIATGDGNTPYTEFEVDYHNQTFKVNSTNLDKALPLDGYSSQVVTFNGDAQAPIGWKATMFIPMPAGYDKTKVHGGLFSILGKGADKTYWATFLPPQVHANFHQPQFFDKFQKCEGK